MKFLLASILAGCCVLQTFASTSSFFDIGHVDSNGNGYFEFKGRRYSTDEEQVITFMDERGCLNRLIISPPENGYPASVQGGISCSAKGRASLLNRDAYYKKR